MPGGLALALAAGAVLRLAAQQPDVVARLDGRVAPDVARAVAGIAASAGAHGLPVEPLVQKAIEGGAKGVPADRILAAVQALAGQLDAAVAVLHEAGIEHPGADLVEGAAEALGAGLAVKQVRELVRASRLPYDPAVTLRVAATVAELGVPAKQTLELIENMITAGRTPDDLLGLPSQVQRGVAHGATPAQAAQGLARGAAHAPGSGPPGGVPPGQAKGRGNPHKP